MHLLRRVYLLKPLQKVAIFLLMIDLSQGKSIIALMDNSEIKTIVSEIGNLLTVSPETQEQVWREFKQLGYEDHANPSEVLSMIRSLFNGSKISNKSSEGCC
jgi:flagellar motor switch protein FliG